jgi:arylsulfatase A
MYADFVMETDDALGQIMTATEKNGIAQDTLIIVTSDNGCSPSADFPLHLSKGHNPSYNLRGHKADIYDGGHRVPFIVRWPGVTPPNQVTAGLMSQIDLMATLAAIVGQALPATAAEDSFDQRALLRGGASTRTSHVHNTSKNHYAMRAGSWVLIDAPSGNVTKVPPGFDAANGYAKNPHPGELYDLSQDKVAELKALLTRLREQGYSAPGKTGRSTGGE